MGIRTVLLLGLTALAVTACHPHPKRQAQPVATTPAVNNAGDVDVIKGSLPPGWPDFIPPYSGATIIEGQSSHSSGVPVLTAVMSTKDAADKVGEFYGLRLSEKQFTIVSTSQVQGESVAVYRHETQSVSISTRADKPQGTHVEVTVVGTWQENKDTAPQVASGSNSPNSGTGGSHKDKPRQLGPDNPMMPVYPGADREDNG